MNSENANVPDSTEDLNLSCDACGKGLLIDSNVRYEVTIEVKAAYDPQELTREDLQRDLEAEIERTLSEMGDLTEEEAKDQVYRNMTFQLCRSCQKQYIKDPLSGVSQSDPE